MNKYIKLLQITDCHLQQTPQTLYKDSYPDQRLAAVVESIQQQFIDTHTDHRNSCFDHLVLSGDLAHFRSLDVYQRLLDKTSNLANTISWLPGNHDDAQLMAEFSRMQRKLIIEGNWAIVLLDSTAKPDGLGSGSLSDNELDFLSNLNEHLIEHQAQSSLFNESVVEHVLVILHHPPIDVGSLWQDEIKLANSDEFWEIVERNDKIKGVSFGHLHQEHYKVKGQVALFCTPATAPQFKKGQPVPVIEDDIELAKPGYRIFNLAPNGTIDSTVYRASSI